MTNHTLRIIGGEWRSRRLPIAVVPGLRPTPDRVRETLFNWLQFEVPQARCLDLFAGSGALGLEALSRGAAHCVFVEKNPLAFAQLRANTQTLKTSKATLYQQDAMHYLQTSSTPPFDIIFLDPPFRQHLVAPVLTQLVERMWLGEVGWIYVEYEAELTIDWIPAPFTIYRQAQAGQVASLLLHYQKNA